MHTKYRAKTETDFISTILGRNSRQSVSEQKLSVAKQEENIRDKTVFSYSKNKSENTNLTKELK